MFIQEMLICNQDALESSKKGVLWSLDLFLKTLEVWKHVLKSQMQCYILQSSEWGKKNHHTPTEITV